MATSNATASVTSVTSVTTSPTTAAAESALSPWKGPPPAAQQLPDSGVLPTVRSDGDGAGARAELAEAPGPSFLATRLRNAKAGKTEVVSFRVWHCGASCTCTPPCLNVVSPELPNTWIDLIDEAGTATTIPDWVRADLTGTFTGKTRSAPSSDGNPGGHDHPMMVPEFKLIGAPTHRGTSMSPDPSDEGSDEPTHARILLAGSEAEKKVERISDDRRYLVVAGTFSLADSGASEQADRFLQRLVARGFQEASREDSRAFVALACCFHVVLAGRFADSKSAEKRRQELAKSGFSAYVKRGL